MKTITIGKHKIGPNQKTFIVAEAGVNHNGNVDRGLEHILAAKKAGADAIKFQNYKGDRLVTKTAKKYWHLKDDVVNQIELFSRFDDLAKKQYQEMANYARKIGITYFSTPFDLESVDLLEELKVPAYKIASADITYFKLLEKVAKTKKPMIVSTGAATLGEIEQAVAVIKKAGNDKIILLHCVLTYPTPAEDANLTMIPSIQRTFPEILVGFSDHTFSPITPALAVMLGAKVIEKHFTIDNNLPDNPDHMLGVNPEGLKTLVDSVRLAEKALGAETKGFIASEKDALEQARRSVVTVMPLKKGAVITAKMVACKRPCTGIPANLYDLVIGRVAKKDIPADTVLTWDLL